MERGVERETMAVKGYVLMNLAARQSKSAITKLVSADMVRWAEAITGPYDVIAAVEAENMETLGRLVTEQIQSIEGVERTLTCIVITL